MFALFLNRHKLKNVYCWTIHVNFWYSWNQQTAEVCALNKLLYCATQFYQHLYTVHINCCLGTVHISDAFNKSQLLSLLCLLKDEIFFRFSYIIIPSRLVTRKNEKLKFSTNFFAEKIRPGPHMNRRKRFRELFRFCGDHKEWKSHVRRHAYFLEIQTFSYF